MRQLVYTNYESGRSGLSNGIMSIEVGVSLAFLTNRLLVLDGNISPPANIVSYGGRVEEPRSRVTDLIDLPVPWTEPDWDELRDLPSRELTDEHLGQLVFYFPGTLDIESEDAKAFARGRQVWIHPGGELDAVPVLKLTEDPVVLREGRRRRNLSLYAYTFYLDDETRRSLYRVLDRMRPKRELAQLASRVAADLGAFNAVHLRRGDFKKTYGVTTLDRQPWEAIEAMDHHFRRDQTLVILTDERDDPFFDEIKAAYPHHVFIDHHILDEYGPDFGRLEARDSLSLAYLSQLVAAESRDFIGTMTSTFTAIVQRYRGNRGLPEPFKFFWNELPEPEHRVERGRHPISECIPLEECLMVEELEGPYSWNRYNQRLAPSWMREWPESFLTEEVLATGALAGRTSSPSPLPGAEPGPAADAGARLHLPFAGLRVAIAPGSRRLSTRIVESFGLRPDPSPTNVIADLEVSGTKPMTLARDGHPRAAADDEASMLRVIKLEIARIFCSARPQHLWLTASAFERGGRAVVVAGDLGSGEDDLSDALCSSGWDLYADDVVPILAKTREALPLGRTGWPKGASVRPRTEPLPVAAIVISARRLKTRDELDRLSPSVAVAELLASSLDFREERVKAVERLCRFVEEVPVLQLSWSRARRAAELLGRIEERIGARSAEPGPQRQTGSRQAEEPEETQEPQEKTA